MNPELMAKQARDAKRHETRKATEEPTTNVNSAAAPSPATPPSGVAAPAPSEAVPVNRKPPNGTGSAGTPIIKPDFTAFPFPALRLVEPDSTFRTLFEEAPYGILMGQDDCRLINVNPAFCKMVGYSRDELIGKTFYDFTHPDDVGRTELVRDNVHGGRYPVRYLKRMVCKDGSVILCRITNSAVFREDGSLLYTFGMVEDVTHLNELEHKQGQLAAIVEASGDGIFSLSLNGVIQTWNRGAERMYGYSAAEAVGKSASLLVGNNPEPRDSYLEAIQKALQGQSGMNLETPHRCKDGREVPVSLTIAPIRNEFQQVEGVSVIARDMTVYHQTLVALDGSQQHMRRTSERLARTNKELEQFAFVASHDLQEPLRTISCFLQLLASNYRGKLDDRADEYIQFAVDGAQRMQKLILDLLHFSRTTRSYSESRPLRMQDMVEIAVSNLHGQIEASGVDVQVSPLPIVLSRDTQLAQVFQNLISNAIKFRTDRPPVIQIFAERLGEEWVFRVRDNGIGFSKDHAERIFLIFQRLHTWEEYPGTGVGLAICKKIIESHGGRIWAEAELGKGATFSFTLPVYEAKPSDPAQIAPGI